MSNNMDILFLGGLFPKETESEIINNSIGAVQNAANVLQWHLVDGLDENNEKPIKIINSLYIGSYPKRYKKMFVKTYEFNHGKNSTDINVGFLNLTGIKHYSKYYSVKNYLKKWAIDGQTDKVIIAYALTDIFVKCLRYIKKLNPKIKTCIIVPDLPEYMNTSDNVSNIYKLLKNVEIKKIEKNLIYIDKFVLLTNNMSDKLKVTDYVVVEGVATDIFDNIDTSYDNELDNGCKYILYTGTLNKKYGVLNLVKAFRNINKPNYKLILCGAGDSENDIVKAQNQDSRILFKGQVTREEVLKLQKKSTVLINPRQNIDEFTKYSFPSKNLEYLSSGTPLIAYKLDGIPDEYDNYIYYVNDNSIKSLKNKIIDICEKDKDELNEFGLKAKQFVLSEKNNIAQAKKIMNLITS